MSGDIAHLEPRRRPATREDGASSPYERRLSELLESVADGRTSPAAAATALRDLPFADLGFAKVDHHRELRQGVCEIVYAQPKSAEEVQAIVEKLIEGNEGPILVTRAFG